MGKYIGIALIVVGVALAYWGYGVYDSASAQLTRAFNGESPMEAWAAMVGGAVCIAIGIFKLK
jgi:uncharacterized membrane protein YidH (DUF202 family)